MKLKLMHLRLIIMGTMVNIDFVLFCHIHPHNDYVLFDNWWNILELCHTMPWYDMIWYDMIWYDMIWYEIDGIILSVIMDWIYDYHSIIYPSIFPSFIPSNQNDEWNEMEWYAKLIKNPNKTNNWNMKRWLWQEIEHLCQMEYHPQTTLQHH